jgi:hypothetical protein
MQLTMTPQIPTKTLYFDTETANPKSTIRMGQLIVHGKAASMEGLVPICTTLGENFSIPTIHCSVFIASHDEKIHR